MQVLCREMLIIITRKLWKSSHESHSRASIKRKKFVNPVQKHKAGCDKKVKEPLSFARDLHTTYISREALTVLCSVVKYAGSR